MQQWENRETKRRNLGLKMRTYPLCLGVLYKHLKIKEGGYNRQILYMQPYRSPQIQVLLQTTKRKHEKEAIWLRIIINHGQNRTPNLSCYAPVFINISPREGMQNESQHRKIHKRNVKYISPSHKHIQIINLGLHCKCKGMLPLHITYKAWRKILEWDTTEQPHRQCA